MKYPVTETWHNAYTLSGLAPGSDSASQTVSAEIVVIEDDIDLPV